jgi:hypothetical protein
MEPAGHGPVMARSWPLRSGYRLVVEAHLRGALVVRVGGSAVAIRRPSRMKTQNIPV